MKRAVGLFGGDLLFNLPARPGSEEDWLLVKGVSFTRRRLGTCFRCLRGYGRRERPFLLYGDAGVGGGGPSPPKGDWKSRSRHSAAFECRRCDTLPVQSNARQVLTRVHDSLNTTLTHTPQTGPNQYDRSEPMWAFFPPPAKIQFVQLKCVCVCVAAYQREVVEM